MHIPVPQQKNINFYQFGKSTLDRDLVQKKVQQKFVHFDFSLEIYNLL